MERAGAAVGALGEQGYGVVHRLDLDMLRQTLRGWRICCARGYWYALRGGRLPTDGPRSLLHCFLCVRNLMVLAEELSLQKYLNRLVHTCRRVALPTVAGRPAP